MRVYGALINVVNERYHPGGILMRVSEQELRTVDSTRDQRHTSTQQDRHNRHLHCIYLPSCQQAAEELTASPQPNLALARFRPEPRQYFAEIISHDHSYIRIVRWA
jgi:hypothetical protein